MPKRTAGLVDETIVSQPGGWVFDAQVAACFDSHVRRSVPLYDELQSLVVELCTRFVHDETVVYDLGASTGETIARLLRRFSRRANTYHAVDSSGPMLQQARRRCGDDGVVVYHECDVTDLPGFPDAGCVLALYTLQFVPVPERAPILRRIHDSLTPGGALILAEKTSSESSRVQALWDSALVRFKLTQGLSLAMIESKARSLDGVLVPLDLATYRRMLTEAGFADIEVFFRWCAFTGIIAVKSPPGN